MRQFKIFNSNVRHISYIKAYAKQRAKIQALKENWLGFFDVQSLIEQKIDSYCTLRSKQQKAIAPSRYKKFLKNIITGKDNRKDQIKEMIQTKYKFWFCNFIDSKLLAALLLSKSKVETFSPKPTQIEIKDYLNKEIDIILNNI